MSNNQIEQIKQFLHNEICERRDYSASKMCEETLKFIEQMNNNNEQYNPLDISWDQYGNPILNGSETPMGEKNNNTNPGTSIDMDDLRSCISLYLNDIESYGRVGEHEEAINVLNDFVEYIDSMNGRCAPPIIEKQWLDNEQSINDYNAMEEESEMDNYNEMQ